MQEILKHQQKKKNYTIFFGAFTLTCPKKELLKYLIVRITKIFYFLLFTAYLMKKKLQNDTQ